jgi:hypothetical protein
MTDGDGSSFGTASRINDVSPWLETLNIQQGEGGLIVRFHP